jgi:hypothetical protein
MVGLMSGTERDDAQPRDHDGVSGRDRDTESEPTESGHSTSDTQEERNREDEPPG